MARRPSSLITASFGTLVVLAFIVAVGRPNVFTDTRDYMIHGARFYQALRRTLLNERPPVPDTPAAQETWRKLQWEKHFGHSNMGARSPYYGIFLYTLAHRGTLWLLTAVQTFVCAWLAYLLWRSMAPAAAPGWTYYALMAALSMGTSLPWVSSFAVPDIFAAVLAMAATLLLFYRTELERWERAGVLSLLAMALVFHGSHLLLVLLLIPLGAAIAFALKAGPGTIRGFAGPVFAAFALAIGLNFVYAKAIQAHTGDEFRRPPFLVARVLADGPGRAYLRYSCAHGAAWAMCQFQNLPLDDSDKILWSALPESGVFNRSDYEARVLMEKQELRFVLGTIAYDPWGQFVASLKDWWLQLIRSWVDDPLRQPHVFLIHNYWGKTNLVGLLRGVGDCGADGEACRLKVKVTDLATVDDPVVLFSLAALIVALFQPQSLGAVRRKTFSWDVDTSRATGAALFLGAAVVLNAAVCGVFSGPFPRYQARIVWLWPATAALLTIALIPARVWARQQLRLPKAWVGAGETLWAMGLDTFHAVRAEIDPVFLRFGVVGATGFAVDTTLLYAFVHGGGLNPYSARLLSFPLAVCVTWILNRTWTFRRTERTGLVRQAAVYFGVQCAGGVANYAVYSTALLLAPVFKHWLVIPVAFGSAAGLCLTFIGSKHLAFRARRGGLPGAVADTPAAS